MELLEIISVVFDIADQLPIMKNAVFWDVSAMWLL
jgi:hypothetical protein